MHDAMLTKSFILQLPYSLQFPRTSNPVHCVHTERVSDRPVLAEPDSPAGPSGGPDGWGGAGGASLAEGPLVYPPARWDQLPFTVGPLGLACAAKGGATLTGGGALSGGGSLATW